MCVNWKIVRRNRQQEESGARPLFLSPDHLNFHPSVNSKHAGCRRRRRAGRPPSVPPSLRPSRALRILRCITLIGRRRRRRMQSLTEKIAEKKKKCAATTAPWPPSVRPSSSFKLQVRLVVVVAAAAAEKATQMITGLCVNARFDFDYSNFTLINN